MPNTPPTPHQLFADRGINPVPPQRDAELKALLADLAKVGEKGAWHYGIAACPHCAKDTDGASVHARTLLVHPAGRWHCARCGWHDGTATQQASQVIHSPDDLSWPLTHSFRQSLADATGLSVSETGWFARAGLFWFPNYPGSTEGAWKPALLRLCSEEDRTLDIQWTEIEDGLPGSWRSTPGAYTYPSGWERHPDEPHVICGSPIDAAAIMATGTVGTVACLTDRIDPHGDNDWSVMAHIEKDALEAKAFILALPNTATGRVIEEELGRRLGREKCSRIRFPIRGSDHLGSGAASLLRAEGAEALLKQVRAAKPLPVKGIHELDDFDDKLDELLLTGLKPGPESGIETLDAHYRAKPGQWTVITGIPSHGKSNFLDQLLIHLAGRQGWKIALFSPENQPCERHFANLIEKRTGRSFFHDRNKISDAEMAEGKEWVGEHFKIILPDPDEGNWSLDGILTLAKSLLLRDGIRGLVIDPWNEIEHAFARNEREDQYLSRALTEIRRFARLHDIHVFVVAHPKTQTHQADGQYAVPTPYSISGGSMWYNKADMALCAYRYPTETDADITDIHIQKVRHKENGRIGRVSLRFDPSCGRYIDDINQELRTLSLEKGLHSPSRDIRTGADRSRVRGKFSKKGTDEF